MVLDPSLERTIVSLAVMIMSTALLIVIPKDLLPAILPLVGSWMGALIANWFNGIQSPTIPVTKIVAQPPTISVVEHSTTVPPAQGGRY